MRQQHRVLYCDCAEASAVSPPTRDAVRRALEDSGLHVDMVPDLCGLAARRAPLLAELSQAPGLAIAACHPRAVKWLFAAGGAPLQDARVLYLDMRDGAAEDHVRAIGELALARATDTDGTDTVAAVTPSTEHVAPGPPAGSAAGGSPGWKPWFPVIDVDRCNSCRQCVGFCLFGVYGIGTDGAVQVKNPSRCKTGCPACSRLCQAEAIIFPKYATAPINGGEVRAGQPATEPVRVDRAALLGDNPLAALRDRNTRDALMSLPPDQLLAVRERFAHLAGARGRHGAGTPGPLPAATNEPT